MIELAETILDLTGSRSSLVYESLPQDDPKQRQPDIALAKGRHVWAPKVTLREGLKPTIGDFEPMIRSEAGHRV